ncbi:hypothetical protein Q5424_05680 [Conexibacter sp. JD483]|uniref:hypothetical protein n=1 Tax=unclassified Conexibacter TaxID=2627773 RepID=UPI0027158D22|nr:MULTISPECIES: hypothetical protein [unclassified Conexibacter]MDO8185952.1 hypothetical protein [Conexibacter sp. CPCC 205706]MDO8199443.1 hypothetical protein [Conexibacter sp. CPCC 205762]MDR9368561.1 hypothetical protein [Conexibacter sp. JD483]
MRARQLPLAAIAAAALAAGAAGCGDDDGAATTAAAEQTQAPPSATEPTASAPDATPPAPPTATDAVPTTTVPNPPSTTPTRAEEQGGGGEEAVRVPATFVIRSGRLTPPTISVPPRLAIELTLRGDDAAHVLVLRAPQPRTLRVAAGGQASLRMPGLRAGSYDITLDGRPAGELIAGGEVGP